MGYLRIGSELLVNTTTPGNQLNCDVTTLSDGRFVITWSDPSAVSRIQNFNANGAKSGSELSLTTMSSISSAVALDGGRFIVTRSYFDPAGGGSSDIDVLAQIFAADGATSGGEFVVNATTTNYQTDSQVTKLADGRFVTTWTDASGTGSDISDLAVRG